LLCQLDEAFEDELLRLAVCVLTGIIFPYLNGSHIGVLGRVLVLVQAVLCEFALAEVDAELDEQYHHRLERDDGAVAGPLRSDMLVQQLEGRLLLIDSDEFLGAFTFLCQSRAAMDLSKRGIQRVLRLGVRWRRHAGQSWIGDPGCLGRGGLRERAGDAARAREVLVSGCCAATMSSRCKKMVGGD
jgi:hypothetical protein